MSKRVLFDMPGFFRQSLIKKHLFYVAQAQKRLLSQFENINAEADQAAKEWLAQRFSHFTHEEDDPCYLYDSAHDAGLEFYELLSDMREQTRLSVVAGMFHEWDKQLRNWLVDEVNRWHRGDNTRTKIWSVDFVQIVDLLENIGWNIRSTDYFHTLDKCRLVVNVYKHGVGKSLKELKNCFPEYLDDPLHRFGDETLSDIKYLDYRHLKVSDDQFQKFSDAILAFWNDVPERVLESQVTNVPDWFGNAIQKDRDLK